MVILTNPKSMIYRNLYENTIRANSTWLDISLCDGHLDQSEAYDIS